MSHQYKHQIPDPILNAKEQKKLDDLTEKFIKMSTPGGVSKAVKKVGTAVVNVVPDQVKELGKTAVQAMTEQEIFSKAMNLISEGFLSTLEFGKYTTSKTFVLKRINKANGKAYFHSLDEICLMRSYDIAKIVGSSKDVNKVFAMAEGGVTGYAGLAGVPANLVASTFLYFRAVQAIAMYYGYDAKNDADEMMIARTVFLGAISPGQDTLNNEMNGLVEKIMMMTQATMVKNTVKKSWAEMASKGGIPLFIAQLRALANESAKKAVQQAGQKTLEESLFKETFEIIGKTLSRRAVERAVPFVSAGVGALIDTALMHRVVEYADIFYHKRFILEKGERIHILLGDYKPTQIIEFE